MLSRRFFSPRERALELPDELDAGMHLLDVFVDAAGEQWLVLNTADSIPYLLPGSRAEELPERLLEQLAVYEMTRDEQSREISCQDLYLLAIESIDETLFTPGANDPVYVDGIVTGPWLSPGQTPQVQAGRLMCTRSDLLFGLLDAVADGFVYPVKPIYGDRSWVSHHLMLPGGTLEETESGRSAILAFPVSLTSTILQEPGNDAAVCDIWHQLLSRIKAETGVGPLEGETIPVPCLRSYRDELRRRGVLLTDEGFVLVQQGSWLAQLWQTMFPRRVPLPPEGDPLVYACLGQLVVDDLDGWPGPRTRALHRCVRRWRVFWTPQFSSGLRLFLGGDVEQRMRFADGALETSSESQGGHARTLYFDVDDSFAEEIRGGVEIELDCFRRAPGSLSVDYYAGHGSRRGRVRRRTCKEQGRSYTWERLRVELTAPRFSNDMTGGTDFCVVLPDGVVSIREVVVRARSRVRQLAPDPVVVERSAQPPLVFVNDASVLKQIDLDSGAAQPVGNRRWALDCHLAARGNLLLTVDQGHLTCVDIVTGLVRLIGKPGWHSRAPLAALDDQLYVLDEERLHAVHPVIGRRALLHEMPRPLAMCATQSSLAIVADDRLLLVELDGRVHRLGGDEWPEASDLCSLGGWIMVIDRGQLFAVELKSGRRQTVGEDEWSPAARLTALDGWLLAADGDKLWRLDPTEGSRQLISADFEHVGELLAVRERDCLIPPSRGIAPPDPNELPQPEQELVAELLSQAPTGGVELVERWYEVATSLGQKGLFQQSLAALRVVIGQAPESARAYWDMGNLLSKQMGDHFMAMRWWEWQAIVDDTDDVVCVELGTLAYDRLREVDTARGWYDEAIRRQPKNAWAYLGIGRLYECAIQDDRKAQEWFRKAMEADTSSPDACTSMAELHFRNARFGDAVRAYQEAQRRETDGTWPLQRIITIYRDYLHDYVKAAKALGQLAELCPREAEPCEQAAELHLSHLDDPRKAVELLEEAWRRAPRIAVAERLASIYRDHLKQPEKQADWERRAAECS